MRNASLPVVAFAVAAMIVIGGYFAIQQSAPGPTLTSSSASSLGSSTSSGVAPALNETILIHVVNSTSGDSMVDEPVTAGPASSANDLATTPGGPTISECVHEVSNGATVSANGTVVSSGTTTTYAPCPLKDYTTNSTGWVTISNQDAAYFFVEAGTMMRSNAEVITIESSLTYVTVPFPQGNFTVSSTESP